MSEAPEVPSDLRSLMRRLEAVGETDLLGIARALAYAHEQDRERMVRALCLDPAARLSLLPAGEVPSSEPLAGAAMVSTRPEGCQVTFLLMDGRAWQAIIQVPSGRLLHSAFDDQVQDEDALVLRRALDLELGEGLPGELACALWAYACAQVPLGADPAAHAVITDPLSMLVEDLSPGEPRASRIARARQGRDWLDAGAAGQLLAHSPGLLCAQAMHLLGLPSAFGRGERPSVVVWRLRRELPEDPMRALREAGHPCADLLARLCAERVRAWGEPVPQWLQGA